jgi:2-polyprenyl-3-methyl-5-hydroxy-6-metoxy-1,4-benzoquinol methylase
MIGRSEGHRICEVGGGARPALTPEEVDELGLEYTLLDVSEEQLEKAPASFNKIVADLNQPFSTTATHDFVFTKWVLEHIREPAQFHSNVKNLLRPEGTAIHYFSTLYSLPFVVNRIAPHSVSEAIMGILQPGTRTGERAGVFPAYYRWCRGPTRRQVERLRSAGFEVEEYVGYFGHAYYNRGHIPRAGPLARVLKRLEVAPLTSHAKVILRKPREPSPDDRSAS